MTKKIVLVLCAIGMLCTVTAGKCSREHVQSVEMMNKCVEYHRKKMFPQAIRDCNKAVTLDPENEGAQHALGMVYIETKEYEQSARHLQKAIALKGDVALYYYQLGEVYQWLAQPEQAATALQKAIELDPSLYKAHYRLGCVYRDMEDAQKALQKFTDALGKNPRFFDAYRDLGALYMDYDFLDQAQQVFDEGIKAMEGHGEEVATLRNFKGTVLAEKKEYEAAVNEFRAALELNPKLTDAMFNLGWSYSYVNKENAKIWLEKFQASAGPQTEPGYLSAAGVRLSEIQMGTPYQ